MRCLFHTLPDSDSFPSPFRSGWDFFFLRYCVSSLSVWCEPIAGGCTDNGSPLIFGKSRIVRCRYLSQNGSAERLPRPRIQCNCAFQTILLLPGNERKEIQPGLFFKCINRDSEILQRTGTSVIRNDKTDHFLRRSQVIDDLVVPIGNRDFVVSDRDAFLFRQNRSVLG